MSCQCKPAPEDAMEYLWEFIAYAYDPPDGTTAEELGLQLTRSIEFIRQCAFALDELVKKAGPDCLGQCDWGAPHGGPCCGGRNMNPVVKVNPGKSPGES